MARTLMCYGPFFSRFPRIDIHNGKNLAFGQTNDM